MNLLMPGKICIQLIRYSLCCGLLWQLLSVSAQGQTTRYVSTTGTTPAASATTSWATSTTDLQGAINASQPGDQVWVASGLYQPALNESYSMKARVAIYGGFVGSETVLTARPSVNPVSGNPSSVTLAGNGSRVITNASSLSLTTTAVLDGFVITGGGNVDQGGGMYNEESSPSLQNCLFVGNVASESGGVVNIAKGGAIYNLRSSNPVLTNCSLQSNSAIASGTNSSIVYGGAIYNEYYSSPVLTNCRLSDNIATALGLGTETSTASGGCISNITFSQPILINCILQNNTALASGNGSNAVYGGAISSESSYPVLTNCSLSGNTATSSGNSYNFVQGGAISSLANSSLVVTNCSLQNNTVMATGDDGSTNVGFGGGFYNASSSLQLINCSLSGNAVSVSGIISDATAGGAISMQLSSSLVLTNCIAWHTDGVINAFDKTNPTSTITATYSLFNNTTNVDITGPGNLTTAISPFASTTSVALGACSPAINAGNPVSQTVATAPYSATALPATDLLRASRIVSNRVDMGALEYQGAPGYPVAFTLTPVSTTVVCAGSSVSVPVGLTGTVVGYQWYKDGSPVVSQTAATLSIPAVTTANAGNYSVVITGTCNSLTSTAISLTVNDLSTFTVNSATVCQGQVASLLASGCNGQVVWSTGATGSSLTVTAGSSTTILTATCTVGSCQATASGNVVGIALPPPAQILSLSTDESACPVRLLGRGVGSSFTFTNTQGYVFSNVFRTGGSHELRGLAVSQPGVYTLTAIYTNECGSSVPVSQMVTVSKACP